MWLLQYRLKYGASVIIWVFSHIAPKQNIKFAREIRSFLYKGGLFPLALYLFQFF